MSRRAFIGTAGASATALGIGLPATAGPAAAETAAGPVAGKARLSPFPLSDVRLLDGPFRANMARTCAYLKFIDADRLLHTFRLNVGLPSSAEPCGGWEAPDVLLRGHTTGHLLTALAQAHANTGDAAYAAKGRYLVAELAKCQAAAPAAGFTAGYLSAFGEETFDQLEAGAKPWAPYYTIHKIMAGLLDQYRLSGDRRALQVVTGMAGWASARTAKLPRERMQALLRVEFGGMNDVLAELYQVTGDPGHLATARRFDHDELYVPLAERRDALNGQHANTQIPKVVGAVRECTHGHAMTRIDIDGHQGLGRLRVTTVKLTVQVRLLPTLEQAAALTETLHACNLAAQLVSQAAVAHRTFSRAGLQKLMYRDVRASGLSAQPALHVIRKTADAYTALRAQNGARGPGTAGSGRRADARSKAITFRSNAAQPFDDRCLSWQIDSRTVSIWTTRGRLRNLSFAGESAQLKTLAEYREGESDLVCRDGKWLLIATCEVPEAPLNTSPHDWIGVDRGIVHLATTSDGDHHQGRGLERYRRRMARVRAELQAKGSRSAKRKLKRRSRREARHSAHVNHKISKMMVAEAQRTGRGIALEDLQGIRDRVRLTRSRRATLSSWPFHQLGEFLAYKAHRAGVPLIEVDPAYTSQTCPRCGHVSRKNRPTRDDFCCVVCGLAGSADHIAAVNVRARARTVWAFVNTPDAAVLPPPGQGQSRAASLFNSG